MQEKENRPLRVALIQRCFPHYRLTLFSRLLKQENVRYTLFFGQKDKQSSLTTINAEDAAEHLGVASDRIGKITNFFLGKCVWQSRVLGIAWSKRFDALIVEGNPFVLTTVIAALLGRLRGKKVYFWTHGFHSKEVGLKGWIRRQYYKLAHGLIHYGARSRSIAIDFGFPAENQFVCFNSLDNKLQLSVRNSITDEQIRQTRAELFDNPEWPLLVWIGRLQPRKQIHLMIEAMKVLQEEGIPSNSLIIGDGRERSNLEKLSKSLELEPYVKFLGHVHDERTVCELLASSDICISPGPVGLTAMHSLGCGTPVITHGDMDEQFPEVEAITEGKTGAFFERNSSRDLARSIKEWIDQGHTREDIRQACAGWVDRYYSPTYQIAVFNSAVEGDSPSIPEVSFEK